MDDRTDEASVDGPFPCTLYQDLIELVVRDSCRLFRYWILDSGVHHHFEESPFDLPTVSSPGIQTSYDNSIHAFEHHMENVQSLFYGGLLGGDHLDSLLMRSIQKRWAISGCPWIFEAPTEYSMAVSQIDWIFTVVGEFAATRTRTTRKEFESPRYYSYQSSLHIIHGIVVETLSATDLFL
jgi:hypothetical protein